MLVNPFRNTTNTFLAPQRSADVAQSKAVSPAPNTIQVPCISGSVFLQEHIPTMNARMRHCSGTLTHNGTMSCNVVNHLQVCII